MSELSCLLKNNYVHDTFHTHVSLTNPKGKYSFSSRSTLEDLWLVYCRAVRSAAVGDSPWSSEELGLAEVPQEYIPVLVDVDVLCEDISQVQDYTVDTIAENTIVFEIIRAYQNVIREVVEDVKDDTLQCVLLTKPYYVTERNGKQMFKNGFHLHFPRLYLSRVEQEVIIIPKVIEILQQREHGEWADMIDRTAIGNTWLLYGSGKEGALNPYLFNTVFDSHLKPYGSLHEAFHDYQLFDAIDERIPITQESAELLLPRILSIVPHGRTLFTIKPTVECSRQFVNRPLVNDRTRADPTHGKPTPLPIVKKLVGLLNTERAVGHVDWMTIGWALFNITDGTDDGLDIWIDFSKNTPDHDEKRCIYEWTRMTNRGTITIGTLRFLAKKDNAKGYYDLVSETRQTAKGHVVTAYDCATLLYEYLGQEFIYGQQQWYQFIGHYWQIADEGIALRKNITAILIPLLESIKKGYERQKLELDEDSSDEKGLEKRIESVKKMLLDLKDTSLKSKVMTECKEVFFDPMFSAKLNMNRQLVGFENGVYDLAENIFRDGQPTDMITTHMPIQYKVFDRSDEQVQEVEHFFEKVFPDQTIRRYFLDIMSETFDGYNHRKQIYFLTGAGDNGKSVTQMFFEKMMGRLSIKSPTTLIMSKRRQSGSANAELARSGEGVRLNWLEEPDPDEEIYEGVLKSLSGNDSFFARDLFEKGKETREIVPMFKMFVVCNELPQIRQGGDNATWNRIRVIPFEATFSLTPPQSVEEQIKQKTFPRDTTLEKRIPHLVEALAWMLLEHRKLTRVSEPAAVVKITEKYRFDNDEMAHFVLGCMVQDPNGQFTLDQAYNGFKEHHRDVMGSVRTVYDRTRFESKLLKAIKVEKIRHMVYKGYRCIERENGGISQQPAGDLF